MAIIWTIIVFGLLLHDVQYASTDSTLTPTNSIPSTTSNPSLTSSQNPPPTSSSISTDFNSTSATSNLATFNTPMHTLNPTNPTTPVSNSQITSSNPSETPSLSTTSPNPTITILQDSTSPIPTSHTDTSVTSLTITDTPQQPKMSDSPQQDTTQITTIQPTTTHSKVTSKESSTQNTPSPSQDTTSSNKPATTIHKESGTTPVNQRDTSAVATNPAPSFTTAVSESVQTTKTQATSAPTTSVAPAISTSTPENISHRAFDHSSISSESVGDFILETCKMKGEKMTGDCSVTFKVEGNQLIATVKINADQMMPTESNKPEKKAEASKETVPDTLIAILASSGALVLILCCFAAYCTYHRRSYRKNQQHLTEEMQTVENGYHDNPTLEVMEVQPEMQEKKLALNGEFNDSWIVPIDNLLKEDIPDEEDTHL
ncbi:podocalyxin isoform X2 [Pimephales promelas]|uniref:podocalyxin isoform X2 n=1 Tax=Pimephales promelas TaxID=90988 RepID=UPI0019557192|nr:podocalyxin isoform X2 [Pimephales promelas]